MREDIFEVIKEKTVYRVPRHPGPISGSVKVPGSKSITNRALLIAALSKGKASFEGVLFSDDSRHFLSSLVALGFEVDIDEPGQRVTVIGHGGQIPNKEATINVGSAGTAARFLTAMLALSDGRYTINCSDQMKKRPMKPLFDALISIGASFDYLEKEGYLPVRVTGNKGICQNISMDITKSTQFLSALLMVAPMTNKGVKITITSPKKDGAYIRITRHMMEQFGVATTFDGNAYHIPKGSNYTIGHYLIEPDMSAACYFYGIAALTGGTILVEGVRSDLIQGDIKFLKVLEALGCHLEAQDLGLQVTGPKEGHYKGIEVDMNDFSDQTMTLAALAVFATSPTHIKNVAHIRLQECNRMEATVNELTSIGCQVTADGENILITPGPVHGATIKTYDDHRMAMAFSLLGLKIDDILIDDPMCCRKTFENYFEVLTNLLKNNA